MPPTIMLLGAAGETGRALAPLILSHTDADLLLAGRRAEALERAAGALGAPGRVRTRALDATRADALAPALEGTDLVIVVAPLAKALPALVRAAATAGADVLDIQYSPGKVAALRALEPEILAAGRTVITDGGFHPGLPGVLLRAAEDRFEVIRSARVGAVFQEDWRALDMTADTAREFVVMLSEMPTAHVVQGRWVREKPTSSAIMRRFDFGPPFGRRTCYAMGLDEIRDWAEGRPGLRDAGFYIAGFNPVMDYGVLPLLYFGRRLAPQRSLGPLTRLTVATLRRFSRPPFGTQLRLEAEGEREGAPVHAALEIAHPDGYVLTALAVAAAVKQWADGSLRRPGVHLQALAVEPHRFLADLEQLGATVTWEASSPARHAAGV